MATKERLSVTVDADLLAAGRATVAAGDAASLSAWVSDALRRQIEHEAHLRGLDEFLAAYEEENGPLTEEDIEESRRWMRERSIRVHGRKVTYPAGYEGKRITDDELDGTTEPRAA